MAQDYDAPRVREEDEPENESLEALKKQRNESAQTALIDIDDNDMADGIDLPGAVWKRNRRSVWFRFSRMSSHACPVS